MCLSVKVIPLTEALQILREYVSSGYLGGSQENEHCRYTTVSLIRGTSRRSQPIPDPTKLKHPDTCFHSTLFFNLATSVAMQSEILSMNKIRYQGR